MISNLHFGTQYGPYLDLSEQILKQSLPEHNMDHI